MNRLSISNFPADTGISDLNKLFSPFGELVNVEIKINCKPIIAYCKYDDESSAQEAVKWLNGYNYKGYTLLVELFKTESQSQKSREYPEKHFGGALQKAVVKQSNTNDGIQETKKLTRSSRKRRNRKMRTENKIGISSGVGHSATIAPNTSSRWDRDICGNKVSENLTNPSLITQKPSRWGGYVFDNVSIIKKDTNNKNTLQKTIAPQLPIATSSKVTVQNIHTHNITTNIHVAKEELPKKRYPIALVNVVTQLREKLASSKLASIPNRQIRWDVPNFNNMQQNSAMNIVGFPQNYLIPVSPLVSYPINMNAMQHRPTAIAIPQLRQNPDNDNFIETKTNFLREKYHTSSRETATTSWNITNNNFLQHVEEIPQQMVKYNNNQENINLIEQKIYSLLENLTSLQQEFPDQILDPTTSHKSEYNAGDLQQFETNDRRDTNLVEQKIYSLLENLTSLQHETPQCPEASKDYNLQKELQLKLYNLLGQSLADQDILPSNSNRAESSNVSKQSKDKVKSLHSKHVPADTWDIVSINDITSQQNTEHIDSSDSTDSSDYNFSNLNSDIIYSDQDDRHCIENRTNTWNDMDSNDKSDTGNTNLQNNNLTQIRQKLLKLQSNRIANTSSNMRHINNNLSQSNKHYERQNNHDNFPDRSSSSYANTVYPSDRIVSGNINDFMSQSNVTEDINRKNNSNNLQGNSSGSVDIFDKIRQKLISVESVKNSPTRNIQQVQYNNSFEKEYGNYDNHNNKNLNVEHTTVADTDLRNFATYNDIPNNKNHNKTDVNIEHTKIEDTDLRIFGNYGTIPMQFNQNQSSVPTDMYSNTNTGYQPTCDIPNYNYTIMNQHTNQNQNSYWPNFIDYNTISHETNIPNKNLIETNTKQTSEYTKFFNDTHQKDITSLKQSSVKRKKTGRQQDKKKTPKQSWFEPEMMEVRTISRKLKNHAKVGGDWEKYKEARREYKKITRRAKRQEIRQMAEETNR